MIYIRPIWASVLLSLIILVSGCHGKDDSSKGQPRVSATVKAESARVISAQIPDLRSFPAHTEAMVAVTLSAKMPGYVKRVLAGEGQQVKKGQLLLVLDSKDVQSRLDALEAARKATLNQKSALEARLGYAQANFKRFERLIKEEAATQEEYDRAEAEYLALSDQVQAFSSKVKEIEARMSEARNQLSYVKITSPVNGWITKRMADPGTYVNPGVPLLRIDDMDSGVWLKAGIDESLLGRIHPGTPVHVKVPAAGIDLKSRISRVIPHVDRSSHTFEVKVDLSHSQAKSGLFGRISIRTGTRQALLIPASAVVKRGAIEGVFTVDENRILHWRVIKTGSEWMQQKDKSFYPCPPGTTAGFLQVLSGLDPEDEIAVSNIDKLREGLRLE